MPATFAHPAAVLPFRRFANRGLPFLALVIGSVSPDFGYYVRRYDVATFAHTIAGSVLVCLPLGLLVFAAFRLVRVPLCSLLPQPHRAALMPLATARFAWTLPAFAASAGAIVLGSWTHCFADAFTHKTGWFAQRLPFLQITLFHIGPADFPVHQLLQHTGSTLGSVLLIGSYISWLRRQPRGASSAACGVSDRTRVTIITGIALVAAAIGMVLAANRSAAFSGYLAFRVFAFQAAISATQVFVPMLIVSAVLFHRRAHRDPRRAAKVHRL